MKTPRHVTAARVLVAIDALTEEAGYSPSFRELSERVGIAIGAVHGYVEELRQQGYLANGTTRHARSLRITEAGREALRPNSD